MFQPRRFRTILTLALAFVLACALAQPAVAAEACLSGDCVNGYGTYEFSSGQVHTGYWKDDKANGHGTRTFPGGEKYVGEYKDGKMHGQGTYTWPDGHKFVGQFRNDLTNGQGTRTWPDGKKYVGEEKDGKKHGQGVFTWPDGRRYVGQYRDDSRTGLGIETAPDGSVKRGVWAEGQLITPLSQQEYAARQANGGQVQAPAAPQGKTEGCLSGDCVNGFGTREFSSGQVHTGYFKNGKAHGQGTRTFPDGSKHVGEYQDGVRGGYGTLDWGGNLRYVGEFKNDVSHGLGVETKAGQVTRRGIWDSDKLITSLSEQEFAARLAGRTGAGQVQAQPPARQRADSCTSGDCVNGFGTYEWADGAVHTGLWKGGKPHGQGSRRYPKGGRYVGEFRDGKRNGQGTYTWPSGKVYVGEFLNEDSHGLGIETATDGTVKRGVWANDELVTPLSEQEFAARLAGQTGAPGAGQVQVPPPQRKAEGCLSGDCVNGFGTYQFASGQVHTGYWKDDKAHGHGTRTFPTGARYVGEYKDGKRNGQGTYFWPDGRSYVGEFLNDDSHGLGLETAPDGTVKRGVWANDKLVTPLSEQEYAARLGQARPTVTPPALAPAQSAPSWMQVAPAPQRERRVALVIGNAAYREGPLRNPVNDARDMAASLKRLGFEVILRTDADLPTMQRAVDEFYASLKKGGAGLFFFAGHGLQVKGANYLVPIGARLTSESDVRFQTLDAGQVLGKMEDAGNNLNLVILDACRNNPYARSFRSGAQGLAKMDAPRGSFIAYATAPGDVAADGTGKNGLYTKHLLKNLGTPGIPVHEMFMRVRLGVVQETKSAQVPWDASSLTGYFFIAQ